MRKKLLLFILSVLILSVNVFATDTQTTNIIQKNIVIDKNEESNFLNLIDNTIEKNNIKYILETKDRQELETIDSKSFIKKSKSKFKEFTKCKNKCFFY